MSGSAHLRPANCKSKGRGLSPVITSSWPSLRFPWLPVSHRKHPDRPFFFLSYPLQTCLPPILIPNPAVMYIEPIPPLSSWDIRAACVHKKCLACLKSLLQVWRGAKFSFLSPGLKKKNCEKKFHRQPRLPAIVSSDLEVVFGFARSGFAHCQVQVVNAQQTVQPISQCRHFNFC